MKNTVPKYYRPFKSIDEPIVNVDSWYDATDAFDEKKYETAVRKLLDYINPAVTGKIGTGNFQFIYPQGSSEIHFELKEEMIYIKAPFLKITPDTNKIALMRRVAELNFNPLFLSQIQLRDDMLWFEYETKLSLCQPYKIYDVLREICVNADDYDDEFIEKYNAAFFHEPKKTVLTSQEQDQAWEQIQNLLQQYKDYMAYFTEKRWDGSEWDIIVITLLQLGNMPYIHGNLRTDLYEYITNMTNGNIDFKFRLDKGKNFMKQLLEKSREDYMKEIYHAQTLMSLKWRSSSKILQEVAADYDSQVKKYLNSDDEFNVCYYLEYMYLRLLYFYTLDSNYKNLVQTTLENASGKTYEEGSKILLDTFNHLLNETFPKNIGVVSKPKKGGFFSKLFG